MTQRTDAEIQATCNKATGLYKALQTITETPQEAADIILMLHVILWLNNGDGTHTTEAMLVDYANDFKTNYDLQVEAGKGSLN